MITIFFLQNKNLLLRLSHLMFIFIFIVSYIISVVLSLNERITFRFLFHSFFSFSRNHTSFPDRTPRNPITFAAMSITMAREYGIGGRKCDSSHTTLVYYGM